MKITKLQKGLASWVLLAGGILLLPVAQAQVYLPGIPGSLAPAADVDPDLYNTFTDSGSSRRAESQIGCGDCFGGFRHRFSSPSVETRGSSPWLVFDWQIKAALPKDLEDIEDFLTVQEEGTLANLLDQSRLNLYFNTEAFGPATGNAAADWGPGCIAETGPVLQAIAMLTPNGLAYSGQADNMQLLANNTVAITEIAFPGVRPFFGQLTIPHDSYALMLTISCPIRSADKPAQIAFQGTMMEETAQRLAANGSSGDLDIQRAASIPANNLWYYPLDGAPAIIDAELGAGGEQAYLDLTFSAPVAVSPPDGAGVFDGAIHLAGMSDPDTGAPTVTSATLTVSGVTYLSTTLLRLHLDADLREISADLQEISEDTTPNFIFIIPPEEGIQGLDGDRLHTGDDWRLAVFFDHEAPYITEAVVTEESRSIVITFSEPVQFGLEFDDSNASSTSSVFPAPSTADFVLVRRSSTGSFIDEFSPAGVMFAESPLLASSGITTLTLEMPTDRKYLPSETVDVRIAERLKDPAHPSLASVFDFVDDDVNFKDSKFGAGPSNFPRTAAPAQVSGLQLRGREYTLVASVPEGPVATGDPSTLTFTLTGSKPLVPGDTVRVSFVTPTGFGEAPESITFDANSTETEVIWTPDRTALDASGQPSVFTVDVEPSIEATGPISVELNAESTARFVFERTFRVAVLLVEPEPDSHDIDIRGVGAKTITLGLTDTGAQLVPGDSTLSLVFELENTDGELLQSEIGISVSSEDTGSVTVYPSQSTLRVVLTPEKSTATFAIAVTDPALAATDLLLVAENIPSSVSFVYEGTDDVCGNRSDCVATVSAAGGRPFTLDFQSASGEFIDVLQLTSGQSTSVMLVFGMSPGDTLNEDESVEVELALADTTEPRVTVSMMLVTFDSNSTTSKVELGVSGDAPSGTFLLQIMRTTVTQGAENERMLIDLPTSEWPVLAAEVRPVVDFIPDLDDDSNIADGFVDAVDSLVPGAIATTVTEAGRPYILVPGIGVETIINVAALLGDNFSPSLGVCVASVMRGGSAPTAPPSAGCDFLSGSLAEDPNIPVSPYRNVLFWVGLSAAGTVATDAGGAPIQVGEPQVVYVAPPVGFKTSFWVYDSTNPDAILPLGIGVGSTNIPDSIALALDLPVADDEAPRVVSFSTNESEYDASVLAGTLTESTEIRITEVEGVAFIAFLDGTGRPSDDGLVRLVEDEKLFSLGNDRVTLVPQASLPTSDMEGRDDGPFLANTPKTIVFEAGSDVTIYRYSSETRAFEPLGQASSVASVTIEASTGRVVIETLPKGATLTELTYLTYPSTSSSIFEIVVSLASTEVVVDPADGTTSIEVVTRTRNIRTFAVDSFPLSKGAGAFTDGARTVTLVRTLASNDEIEGGPYATHSGGGSSVFAEADLFPALPGMVGEVFDYVVKGGPPLESGRTGSPLEGGRAAVTIEFADGQEVDGLAYHVYQRQSDEGWGWAPFVVDDANRIYSAPKPCPALSASREAVVPEPGRVYAWELAHEGLGTDHRCVLVEFSDGGMNDADQTANAFAYSTGAFASSGSLRGRGGGAVALVWLLALTLIVLLAGAGNRRRRATRAD